MKPKFFEKDNQLYVTDPYAKGSIKTGVTPVIIDKSILKEVRLYMMSLWLSKNFSGFNPEKRLLTFEETWEGVEDNPFLGSLKMTSSSGYPYKFLKKGHDKQAWFGTLENPKGYDHPDMLKLRDDFNKCLANLKIGKRNNPISIEELKIELRSKEKIAETKTRVFNMSNVIQICIGRALFGQFVSKVMDNRIYNGSSVGINNHTEFSILKTYLNQVGDNVIAGDYTNYDGTLPPAIVKEFATVVNAWYNDDYSLARITFIHDLIYSARIRGKYVFETLSGQPSGNYLTSMINTFVNIASTCYCYLKVAPPEYSTIDLFDKNVKMNAFGDDNLISVSDDVKGFFNMQTISAAFLEHLGMVYTDESKSINDTVPYKSLLDCSYLQHFFIYNERDGMYVGVREEDKIVETLNWIQSKTLSVKEQMECNVEAVTQEYSRYPLEQYEDFVERLTRHLIDADLASVTKKIVKYEQDPVNDVFNLRYKSAKTDINSDFYF